MIKCQILILDISDKHLGFVTSKVNNAIIIAIIFVFIKK